MKYLRRKRETKYRKSRKNRRNRKNKTRKIKGGFGFLTVASMISFGYLTAIPSGLTNNSLIAVTDSSGRRPPNLPYTDKLLVIKDPQNRPNEIQELDAHGFSSTTAGDFMNLREASNSEELLKQHEKMQFVPFNYLFNQNQKPGEVNFFDSGIKDPGEVERHINELYPLK